MADGDLSTQFEKISDKAKAAADQLRAANERTRASSKPTSPARVNARTPRPIV